MIAAEGNDFSLGHDVDSLFSTDGMTQVTLEGGMSRGGVEGDMAWESEVFLIELHGVEAVGVVPMTRSAPASISRRASGRWYCARGPLHIRQVAEGHAPVQRDDRRRRSASWPHGSGIRLPALPAHAPRSAPRGRAGCVSSRKVLSNSNF